MWRAASLIIVLALAGWHLDREQRAGRFRQADDAFLDFLLANARDRFVPQNAAEPGEVVFVRIREEDRGEYSAWPPQPLDWQMLVKSLAAFEPSVLVIADPLSWPEPQPDFIPALGDALLPLPSVVLAATASTEGEAADPAAEKLRIQELFPAISRISGDASRIPAVRKIVTMPEESIRRHAETGLLLDASAGDRSAVPVALTASGIAVPSVMLQALARHTRTPYAAQRLRAGPGAGMVLGDGMFLPLDPDAAFVFDPNVKILTVNALDFLAGDLADVPSAEDKAKLGRNKLVVIGTDREGGPPAAARAQALALSQALSLPRIREMSDWQRWLVCGLAGLAGLLLLRWRGGKALRMGLLMIFAALVASFLSFQISLVWFAPAVPAAMLAASALFAMVFGRGEKTVQASGADAAASQD